MTNRRFTMADVGRVLALSAFLTTLPLGISQAQEYDMYATLIKSKGYVVGSPLSQSGLHQWSGDTTWAHLGWNHPHISAISTLPEEPNVIFLAGGNGLLRSLDGGKQWKIVTGWQITELQDVKIDPDKPTDVYLSAAYGIWKSTDRGETWKEAMTGLPKKYTQRLVFDQSKTGRLLAATDGGVYESMNAESWTRLSDDVPILDLEQSAADPNVWIAATRGKGVITSKDNGKTWTYAKGRNFNGKNFYASTVDPNNANHMAAAGWDTGVMISTNGGRSWKKVTKGLPIDDYYQVEFDPGHTGRLWASTFEEGLFYTDNDGRNWTYAGLFGTLVFDIEFVRRGAK